MPVLLLVVALTIACGWVVAQGLGIDTGTEEMIDEEVAFRQNEARFDRLFPQFDGTVVAVIDATTPEDASDGAARLAEALRAEPALFPDVYRPGSEPIFAEAGMLYLDLETLYALSDRLVAAQPLLGVLANDPTLGGLAMVLEQATTRPEMLADGEAAGALADLLARMIVVAEAQAADEPLALSWQSLVTGDSGLLAAGRRFLVLRPTLERGALQPAAAALDRLQALIRAEGLVPENGYRVRLTGPVVLDHQELQSVELGGSVAGILSLALVALLLGFGLRSGRLVVAMVATLVVGLVWTAAFATLAVGTLNLISVAFAVLFIGLGVDFGIHACLRYREEVRAGGPGPLPRAFGATGGGILLSAICAAAGFFAFLPTDYRGLAELGVIAGGGMIVAVLATFTVLPAVLGLLPLRAVPPPRAGGGRRIPTLPAPATLGVAAVATAVALVAAPGGTFDFDPINLKDPGFESVRTFFELARDPETTPYQINVLADGQAEAQTLSRRLAALPEVGSVRMLDDFVPSGQENKLTALDDLAFVIQPLLMARPSREAIDPSVQAAAYGRLRETVAAARDLPAPLGPTAAELAETLDALAQSEPNPAPEYDDRLMRHFPGALERLQTAVSPTEEIAPDDLPESLRERWTAEPEGQAAVYRLEVRPAGAIRDNAELRSFAEAVLAVAPGATGAPVIISGAADAILEAFAIASAIAFVAVLAILAIALRRPAEIALVTATLLLAALWTAGAAALFDIAFNFANIIALPLLFGLGVASAIHFVLRLREEGDGEKVLRSSTTSGVLFSALTTIAAFGSLAVSGHRGMASMGELLTLAIALTLVATLVVLPAMIAILQRHRTRNGRDPIDGRRRQP